MCQSHTDSEPAISSDDGDDNNDDGGADDATDDIIGDDGSVDFHRGLSCPNLHTNIDCRPSEVEMTRLLVFNVSERIYSIR